ncbi:MAG: hypothetical protein K0V04_11385 [Deltaproteobacteria bacterium]|nr:hypothetical protein [Deltaproteobacteria bacterium]
MNTRNTNLLALALLLSTGAAACDQAEAPEVSEVSMRKGVGTGTGLTLNTNRWVSPSARDVYEFKRDGSWHTNSFGYETRLDSITVVDTLYGDVTTELNEPPVDGEAHLEIVPGDDFMVRVEGPNPDDAVEDLDAEDLVDMELAFTVRAPDGIDHDVVLVVASFVTDPSAGDFYEFNKIDPVNDVVIGPLCQVDEMNHRSARIYDGLQVDGETGVMAYTGAALHHIACTASAPGKAVQFGYCPADVHIDAFVMANRAIRADYCADGHPYTFPGNLLDIDDNLQTPTMTVADAYDNLESGQTIEAVWNENGVLCVSKPRAASIMREDIVCPFKEMADGTYAYNWTPPTCDGYIDDNPNGDIRLYTRTAQ